VKPLFVDTSGFVALAQSKDRNHGRARRFFRLLARTRRPLLTSTYVADEVITLVRMRIGHTAAVETGRAILDSKWCRLLDIDEELRTSAWNLFVRYQDQEFSFTDCTSFAIMKALGLDEAFTFDRTDFAAAGFSALPLD
jgi:predicted nucleic acid-binding protein